MPLTGEALIRVQADVTNAVTAMRALESSLKQSTGAGDKLKASTVAGTDGMKRFGGTVSDVVRQMTGLNVASLVGAGGVAIAGKAIIDATKAAMNYGLQMGDLSTKLGIPGDTLADKLLLWAARRSDATHARWSEEGYIEDHSRITGWDPLGFPHLKN